MKVAYNDKFDSPPKIKISFSSYIKTIFKFSLSIYIYSATRFLFGQEYGVTVKLYSYVTTQTRLLNVHY